MRKLGVAGLVVTLGLGCSGSDKGSSNGGAVDPASQDFCLQWANEVCRLAYQCVDAAGQDAAFHARYGASNDVCWEGLAQRCESNQSGNTAFGPSCGPGKKVNTDLASACTDSLDLDVCTVWMAAPSGACDLVCATTVSGTGTGGAGNVAGLGGSSNLGGSGNLGGASNPSGSGGSGTTTGSLATSRQFCEAEESVFCDRIFECNPTAASQLGTLADCKASISDECASAEFCPGSYDASKAPACVTATQTLTCAELMTEPMVCEQACQ